MWIYDSNLCFKEIWRVVEIWSFWVQVLLFTVSFVQARSTDQSTDLALFPCFDFGLSYSFPVCFIGFPRCFPALCLTCFTHRDGEWLVYRMWLGGAFTFIFFTLCYAFPGTTPQIPSIHEHPLRVQPLQDRTRCIASLIHQISSRHYDFKALADPVCNV